MDLKATAELSLLQRAQQLARRRTVAGGGGLVLATLAAAAQAGVIFPDTIAPPPTTGQVSNVRADYGFIGSGGGTYGSSSGPTNFNASTFSLTSTATGISVGGIATPVLKLNGTISISGAPLGPLYTLTLTGVLPSSAANGAVYMGFTFTPTFSGGTTLSFDSMSINTSVGGFSASTPGALTSGSAASASILTGDFTGVSNFAFTATIQFTWNGAGAGSSLNIDIPSSSLDIGFRPVSAVPEPGTVAVGVGGAVLAVWTMLRRRRPVMALR